MEKRGRGRPGYNQTPEQAALRSRVLALRRRPRPLNSHGDKHAWVSEFVALYEARAWEVMHESRTLYVKRFGLSDSRVSEYKTYLHVFDLAVKAGVNPYILRFVPIRVVYDMRRYIRHPNILVRELAGDRAAQERKRRVHNRSKRAAYRRKRAMDTVVE